MLPLPINEIGLMTDNMVEAASAVKPSRREAGEARRQVLLDAAGRLIFARGYDAVSLAEIGAAAGVSGPAIYRHFDSKSAILQTLCHHTIDRLIEFVGPRRSDPRDELRALIQGQVRLVIRYPELVRVFEDEERSLPRDLRRQVRDRERGHARRWTEVLRLLRPDLRDDALESIVFATVGMILSMPRWPIALRSLPGLEAQLCGAAWRVIGVNGE